MKKRNGIKYIDFELVYQLPKTARFAVRNIKSQSIVGYVKWYNGWRQYCFFPEPDCIFSSECLNDIINFIQNEEEKRIRRRG